MGEQCVCIAFESLRRVSAGGEPSRRFLEAAESHDRVGELGSIVAVFGIQAAPAGNGCSDTLGVLNDRGLGVSGGLS